jgi:hypothetical protein
MMALPVDNLRRRVPIFAEAVDLRSFANHVRAKARNNPSSASSNERRKLPNQTTAAASMSGQ